MRLSDKKEFKICISTQDPSIVGGISTWVEVITNYFFQKEYNYKLMFARQFEKNLYLDKILEKNVKNRILLKNAIISRSYFPISYPNFILYGEIQKKKFDQFNIFQQIGGSCFEAIPFLKAKKKYICWVATTLLDEWKNTYDSHSFHRPLSWIRGTINNFSLSALRKLEKKIYENATIINAISKKTAILIGKEFKINKDKLRVLPPPLDFSEIQKLEYESSKENHPDYIIFVGTLKKRKNIGILLKALEIVIKTFHNLKLIIIGDGPEKNHIYRMVLSLNLKTNVIFKGYVNKTKKFELIKNAKILVLSSSQEGFGIVLAEALALSVPVISTNCGGPAEIIDDGKTGYLVNIGDYQGIAKKIILLLQDEKLRKQFGIRGQNIVKKKYNVKSINENLIDQYRDLVE